MIGHNLTNHNEFSSEDELLLLLVQGRLTSEMQDKTQYLLEQKLCWPLIMRQAQAHGVSPLVYRSLQGLDFYRAPRPVRIALEDEYRRNALSNTLLSRELTQVLRLLGGAGIPVIPLKGVTLAESLYGDITLRVCGDIDILVPHETVAQALRLLLSRGYKTEFTEPFFYDLLLRRDIEYLLMREERHCRYLVELHWGLLWGWPWDKAAAKVIWDEAQPRTYSGATVSSLSPECELLFLAVHAARHRWQMLKWLVDIHVICSSWRIDWDKLREKAKHLEWEFALRLTLSACHALFDTQMPANLRLTVLPPWLELFPTCSPPTWRNAFFPTRLLRRRAEKTRYAARVFFLPTLAERRFLRLPLLLAFLYYPMRPLRLGCKWSWWLICAAFKRIGF